MDNGNIIAKLCLAVVVILAYFIFVNKIGVLEMVLGSKASPDGTYKAVTVDKLFEDLENNAIFAEDKYKGKYVAVTGTLGIIEKDYIGILKINDTYSLDSVYCYIKNNAQKNAIKTMNKGDIITVRGKIRNIRKIVGCYYLNMTEIPNKY